MSRFLHSAEIREFGIGICLILLFFWKLAFTNLILARGDTFLYFYPYWDYRARELLAGHLPLWNPYLFMGVPFLANSQAGVLYPLNWPLVFFPAPVAVKISILLHLGIAAVGAQLFARRALGQSAAGALLSALFFALGGYLTSQVEHINQLQGLAWFPWLLLAIRNSQLAIPNSPFATQPTRILLRRLTLGLVPCALLLTFQLLAGHTQSAFISLTGVTLYASSQLATRNSQLATRNSQFAIPNWLLSILYLSFFIFAFVLLAGLLSSAQLLPTLELSRQSLRGGGLPLREALSFSLPPRLLGRALLPGYSRSLFSEFVAYVGVVGVALAALGTLEARKTPARFALLVLTVGGLVFALGAYSPVYALLAALAPFNFFRVPARWLFLFGFGSAMLAGHGLDSLPARPPRLWLLFLPLLLVALSLLGNNLIPPGETGPLNAPTFLDLVGWLLPLLILAALAFFRFPYRWRASSILLLATLELFAAAQVLPYNHLTTPEAYSSVRPAMTQLLASLHDTLPASRFLSMSALRFDPGDLAELHSELDSQLPPDAVNDAVIATKNKEVLSPNLPLAWGVPAVDGYDGGILPLKNYAAFTALFTGSPPEDGRLRENLTALPGPRLLSLANVHYLITDKVDDQWIGDVFYDQQFKLSLKPGETSAVAYVPSFQATALGLVSDSPSGLVRLTFSDGSSADLPVTTNRVHFDHPAAPVSITLVGPLAVRGLSLIDERSGAFQSLALGPFRLVHSGDVKIYANLNVLPRAFVVPPQGAVVIPEDAAARAALADPNFDPASTVILASAPPKSPPISGGKPGRAAITDYAPERVRLTAEGPGYLLLTDAYYPGWTATVDARPLPILRADIMFRAVELPAGSHTVEFRFEPASLKLGLWISGFTWPVVIGALVLLRIKKADA